ncbi:MAG: acetolactate synthase-1/2/3 large subunit [Saprospiraceae bacterium]
MLQKKRHMNAAKLMINCLENEGVKYIFGVPGEENEDFLFALEDSSIIFVAVRHEQGGAFMADVWGRLSGKSGVCLSTLGPGATNLMTGIADANLDKAPLVAITGQGDSTRLHHESHQVIDVVKMMEPITKWNSSINSVEVVPEIVRKAFKIAETEKPGATHIELPEDIAGMEVMENLKPLPKTKVQRPSPNQGALNKAIEMINCAERPIIIAGNGAIRNRSSRALTALSKKFNIPVACTFMGKGAVSDREPTSLGAVGLGFKDHVIEAFEKADLVICIGYDIAEYDPQNWNENNDNQIIHIDFDPAEVYTHYIPTVEVIGDLADSMDIMLESIDHEPYDDWYISIRENIFESINSYAQDDDSKIFNAPGVVHAVREMLPDSGLVISDVGSHKMWIARNFQTYVPNGCIISNGLATMGISLPGGIAAKLVDPDRAVVCIMGDGGALMNIQELETAKRLGVGCIFIVVNDNNYGLIKWKQKMSEGKSFGTNLGNPDFVKLAESFDINGYQPTSIANLKEILSNAINTNELCLIEIPITTEVNDQLTEELADYFDYA